MIILAVGIGLTAAAAIVAAGVTLTIVPRIVARRQRGTRRLEVARCVSFGLGNQLKLELGQPFQF